MSKTHRNALLAITAACSIAGCRGDRHVEVIELAAKAKPTEAPKVATAEPVEHTPPPAPPKPKNTWSPEPPQDGVVLQMERVGPHLMRVTGDEFALDLRIPKLGECDAALTQLQTPEMMPDAHVNERPAWLALQGDHEAASIRLSTRGAMLVVDDGCVRAGDITTALLGTSKGSTDPVFEAEIVAPERSYDADDVRMKRRGATKALILVDNKPLLDVSFFNGESTLTARALDEQRWIRLLLTREWEYAQNDGAVGREHTLVWMPRHDDEPLLVMDNDYRYGMDGFAREEADVVATRAFQHREGILRAAGTRQLVYVQNAGRDLCPAADQAFSFRHYDEEVEWTFDVEGSKRPVKLGTARNRSTFAGGCLDVAQKELKRRREKLTTKAPDARVRWDTPN